MFTLIYERVFHLSIPYGPSFCSVALNTRAKNGQVFFDFLHSNFLFFPYIYFEFLRKVIEQNVRFIYIPMLIITKN